MRMLLAADRRRLTHWLCGPKATPRGLGRQRQDRSLTVEGERAEVRPILRRAIQNLLRNNWPQINADERRWKTGDSSAFISVYLRPQKVFGADTLSPRRSGHKGALSARAVASHRQDRSLTVAARHAVARPTLSRAREQAVSPVIDGA